MLRSLLYSRWSPPLSFSPPETRRGNEPIQNRECISCVCVCVDSKAELSSTACTRAINDNMFLNTSLSFLLPNCERSVNYIKLNEQLYWTWGKQYHTSMTVWFNNRSRVFVWFCFFVYYVFAKEAKHQTSPSNTDIHPVWNRSFTWKRFVIGFCSTPGFPVFYLPLEEPAATIGSDRGHRFS